MGNLFIQHLSGRIFPKREHGLANGQIAAGIGYKAKGVERTRKIFKISRWICAKN